MPPCSSRLDAADLRDARLGGAFLVGAFLSPEEVSRLLAPICAVRIYAWQSWTVRICPMPFWIALKA
jgi:hypothetical protein